MTQLALAVVGAGEASAATVQLAFELGQRIAGAGAILICGGRGGLMEAAARGAHAAGGITVGILPSYDRGDANPSIDIAIVTGMGQARNVIVVASADAVIALEGEGGTLSEIGLALKLGRPVIALCAWPELAAVEHCGTPHEALERALSRCRPAPRE